jgi:hypothetical protein
MGSGGNQGTEIIDVPDFAVWHKQAAKPVNIEPLVMCALHRAIIQVESINVDNRLHEPHHDLKKAEAD